MHLFNVATLLVVLTLAGVEFSVSAFVNPAASRLEPESQLKMLSRSALVLGKVMPVWYSLSTLFLGIQTWLCWHTPGRAILLTADAIWVLISVASIFVLVPLASRVAEGAADWQRIHRIWDRRHRVRIAALATAAEVHHWPPHAVAPQTIFLAASGRFAVASTNAGFCPPSSSTTGVRFSAAARMITLPTFTLPVKKMKSNGSLRSSVISSRLPETAATDRGSKYFGMRSNKSLLVAGKPSETLRMQGLPAARTLTAGSKSNVNGPLKGPMTRVTPYGSRKTLAVCPLAASAFGTTTSTGFIHSFSSAFAKVAVASGACTSKTFS